MKRQNCIMRILVFSIFMGYILPVFPQYTIKGLLQGTEQTALPYASVRLLRTDSTFVSGTVTDSLGCYHLNQVSSNDYLLAFSTGVITLIRYLLMITCSLSAPSAINRK